MSPPKILLLVVLLGAALPVASATAGSPDVAALQVALRARSLYHGGIDGIRGPATRAATRSFQRAAGLPVTGVAGPRTRRALGRHGRPRLGSRLLGPGASGWDVVALQFLLGRHGFPSGPVDGGLGPRTQAAILRMQQFAGLPRTGIAGPRTLRRLRRAPMRPPVRLHRPSGAPISSRFGPRGTAFHAGVDFAAPLGAPVRASGPGRISWAGPRDGGYGLMVTVHHGRSIRTLYPHLSRILVRRGQRVRTGQVIGAAGATGRSSGPHLHWELRVRGAALDPLRALHR